MAVCPDKVAILSWVTRLEGVEGRVSVMPSLVVLSDVVDEARCWGSHRADGGFEDVDADEDREKGVDTDPDDWSG